MSEPDTSPQDRPDFWERLAARTEPAAALATIESPRTIGRLVTGTLLGAAVLTGSFAAVLFGFGEAMAGWATVALSATYLATWIWFAATGRVWGPAVFATVVSVANQAAVHVSLGGYAYSGAYIMWGITLTFALVLMLGRREAVLTGAVYVVLAVVLALLEPSLAAGRSPPPAALSSIMFAAVLIGNLIMVTSVLVYFVVRLAFERARAERLLLNVLPAEVAAELKERGTTRARRFQSISVLFADIVGFTQRYAGVDPELMVDQLNEIFTYFDDLADRYECEKIRTIGDAYMVAAGVPVARPDHAHAAAAMALEMLDYAASTPFQFRIGINSGPVVAGVIGNRKFQYDVWGDTVNTASRMESHGEPGRIQISEATYRLIRDEFECVPRGTIPVKGKGELPTWYLEARRETPATDVSSRVEG
ncbi:MAG: adenylate/guanylate cyclase domain-containing protein [Actinomycetota bacterium]